MDYKLSKNVALFIANLVTIKQKKSHDKRALVTGSPISQHLAYICNKKMFDEIFIESKKYHINFSLFVDDLAFSSKTIIPFTFQKRIYNIIKKYKYTISNQKSYRGKIGEHANITGVKITKNGLRILDKHALKISSTNDPLKLKGLLGYALQVNKPFYQKLYSNEIKKMKFKNL